jgi:hypothetical protein
MILYEPDPDRQAVLRARTVQGFEPPKAAEVGTMADQWTIIHGGRKKRKKRRRPEVEMVDLIRRTLAEDLPGLLDVLGIKGGQP